MRRRFVAKDPSLTLGPLALDTVRRQAFRDGEALPLTGSEYALLERLAYGRGRVHSQAALIERLHPGDAVVTSNLIEKLISTLRKKIDRPGTPSLIRTRRGFGYVIE